MAGALRVFVLLASLVVAGGVFVSAVHAQDPDSLSVIADTSGLALDSLLVAADSGAVEVDSLVIVVDTLPRMASGVAPSYANGVWVWGRRALESTIAITLSELVDLVPGVMSLRGGDYGAPVGASEFGLGGGRVRVVWDGFEWAALDGAVTVTTCRGASTSSAVAIPCSLKRADRAWSSAYLSSKRV